MIYTPMDLGFKFVQNRYQGEEVGHQIRYRMLRLGKISVSFKGHKLTPMFIKGMCESLVGYSYPKTYKEIEKLVTFEGEDSDLEEIQREMRSVVCK